MASAMEKLCSDANVTVEDPEDLKSPFAVHLFREDSTDDASRSGDDGHLPDMTALVSVVNGLLCSCVQTSMDWGSPCAVGVVLPFRDRGLQQKYIVFLDGEYGVTFTHNRGTAADKKNWDDVDTWSTFPEKRPDVAVAAMVGFSFPEGVAISHVVSAGLPLGTDSDKEKYLEGLAKFGHMQRHRKDINFMTRVKETHVVLSVSRREDLKVVRGFLERTSRVLTRDEQKAMEDALVEGTADAEVAAAEASEGSVPASEQAAHEDTFAEEPDGLVLSVDETNKISRAAASAQTLVDYLKLPLPEEPLDRRSVMAILYKSVTNLNEGNHTAAVIEKDRPVPPDEIEKVCAAAAKGTDIVEFLRLPLVTKCIDKDSHTAILYTTLTAVRRSLGLLPAESKSADTDVMEQQLKQYEKEIASKNELLAEFRKSSRIAKEMRQGMQRRHAEEIDQKKKDHEASIRDLKEKHATEVAAAARGKVYPQRHQEVQTEKLQHVAVSVDEGGTAILDREGSVTYMGGEEDYNVAGDGEDFGNEEDEQADHGDEGTGGEMTIEKDKALEEVTQDKAEDERDEGDDAFDMVQKEGEDTSANGSVSSNATTSLAELEAQEDPSTSKLTAPAVVVPEINAPAVAPAANPSAPAAGSSMEAATPGASTETVLGVGGTIPAGTEAIDSAKGGGGMSTAVRRSKGGQGGGIAGSKAVNFKDILRGATSGKVTRPTGARSKRTTGSAMSFSAGTSTTAVPAAGASSTTPTSEPSTSGLNAPGTGGEELIGEDESSDMDSSSTTEVGEETSGKGKKRTPGKVKGPSTPVKRRKKNKDLVKVATPSQQMKKLWKDAIKGSRPNLSAEEYPFQIVTPEERKALSANAIEMCATKFIDFPQNPTATAADQLKAQRQLKRVREMHRAFVSIFQEYDNFKVKVIDFAAEFPKDGEDVERQRENLSRLRTVKRRNHLWGLVGMDYHVRRVTPITTPRAQPVPSTRGLCLATLKAEVFVILYKPAHRMQMHHEVVFDLFAASDNYFVGPDMDVLCHIFVQDEVIRGQDMHPENFVSTSKGFLKLFKDLTTAQTEMLKELPLDWFTVDYVLLGAAKCLGVDPEDFTQWKDDLREQLRMAELHMSGYGEYCSTHVKTDKHGSQRFYVWGCVGSLVLYCLAVLRMAYGNMCSKGHITPRSEIERTETFIKYIMTWTVNKCSGKDAKVPQLDEMADYLDVQLSPLFNTSDKEYFRCESETISGVAIKYGDMRMLVMPEGRVPPVLQLEWCSMLNLESQTTKVGGKRMYQSLQMLKSDRVGDWVKRGGAKDTAAAVVELCPGGLAKETIVAMSNLADSPVCFVFSFNKVQCFMRAFMFEEERQVAVLAQFMGAAIMEELAALGDGFKKTLTLVDKDPQESNCEQAKEKGDAEILAMVSLLMLAKKPDDNPYPQQYTGMTIFSMRDNLKRSIAKRVVAIGPKKGVSNPTTAPTAPPLTAVATDKETPGESSGGRSTGARRKVTYDKK